MIGQKGAGNPVLRVSLGRSGGAKARRGAVLVCGILTFNEGWRTRSRVSSAGTCPATASAGRSAVIAGLRRAALRDAGDGGGSGQEGAMRVVIKSGESQWPPSTGGESESGNMKGPACNRPSAGKARIVRCGNGVKHRICHPFRPGLGKEWASDPAPFTISLAGRYTEIRCTPQAPPCRRFATGLVDQGTEPSPVAPLARSFGRRAGVRARESPGKRLPLRKSSPPSPMKQSGSQGAHRQSPHERRPVSGYRRNRLPRLADSGSRVEALGAYPLATPQLREVDRALA